MAKRGEDQYSGLGVESRKGRYGKMFTSVDATPFPHAFCKIYIDEKTGMAECLHSDGVGSKSVQRYLHWKETGNPDVFEGDVDDCLEMNLGDVACAGLEPHMFVDSIAMNKRRVPKEEYLKAINKRMAELKELYASHGMGFIFAGGETADLPDQERTYTMEGTVYARGRKRDVITCERIAPGDIIMGIRSGGPCRLEGREENSGIMSNGVTLARHSLMAKRYNLMHELKDPEGKGYTGPFAVPKEDGLAISKAIVSPTRHFSIIVHRLLEVGRKNVHGLVLNTGGGQTKCTRVGENILYVKDNLPMPDGIFVQIQRFSGESDENMYKTFNMGIGLDVIGPPSIGPLVREVADEFGVGCGQSGHCEHTKGKNRLIIKGMSGELTYDAE